MSRKAQVILIGVSALAASGLAAWLAIHGAGNAAAHPGDGLQVTDMTRRAVRVPANPRRILSLCTSATQTLATIGQAGRLAAIDEYGRLVAGVAHATVVGKGSMISREQVLALGIDLAFVWWYQDDAAAMLEGMSVPVVRIRGTRAAEAPEMIRLVGLCVGCSQPADEAARRVEDYLRRAAPHATPADRPRVYLELYGAFKTVGRDSYTNDLIELAGGTNIAAEASGSVLLSAERLAQADPDTILYVEGFATPAAIAARPGMSEMRAVKAGRLRQVSRQWLIAGPSLPQAVDQLRAIIEAPAQSERR